MNHTFALVLLLVVSGVVLVGLLALLRGAATEAASPPRPPDVVPLAPTPWTPPATPSNGTRVVIAAPSPAALPVTTPEGAVVVDVAKVLTERDTARSAAAALEARLTLAETALRTVGEAVSVAVLMHASVALLAREVDHVIGRYDADVHVATHGPTNDGK